MLLLLLWRHISFYAEGRHINNPSLKTSTAGLVRYLSAAADEDEFRMDVARRLAPVIQRVGALDLVRTLIILYPGACPVVMRTHRDWFWGQDYELTGHDWRSNLAYLEVMARRLIDAMGMQVEDTESWVTDGYGN